MQLSDDMTSSVTSVADKKNSFTKKSRFYGTMFYDIRLLFTQNHIKK